MGITPNDILKLTKPTEDFLCPISANKCNIEFLAFSISDYETKEVLFDIDGSDATEGALEIDIDHNAPITEDTFRKIKYTFSEKVLRLPLISTSLTFKVGSQPVSNFRMIERHYYKENLVKSFDFTFGFCIPDSTNTWEAVYDIPSLDNYLIDEMICNPFETRSDSFYFVGDELIMHNKASYSYIARPTQSRMIYDGDDAEAKTASPSRFDKNEKKSIFVDDETHLASSFGEAKISSPDESLDSCSESKSYRRSNNEDAHWVKETESKSRF